MINKRVVSMIKSAAEQNGHSIKESTDDKNIPEWEPIPSEYFLRWVTFAVGDKTRLSGFQKNITLEKTPPDDNFRLEKGTYVKPAKLLKCYMPELVDHEINLVAQTLASDLRSLNDFDMSEIIVHPTPSDVYTTRLHGSINSCMSCVPKSYFELYDELDTCSIAYKIEDGIVVGRALLWDEVYFVNDDSPFKLMDRIYFASDMVLQQFKMWAKLNGYHHKVNQSICDPYIMTPEGMVTDDSIYIFTPDLTEMGFKRVPYMDTLCKYDCNGQTLHNSSYAFPEDTTMNNTNGTDSNNLIISPETHCNICGCGLDSEDEEHFADDYGPMCEQCYCDNYTSCYECGDTVGNDYVTRVEPIGEYVCEHCLDRYYTRCDDCGECFHTSGINSRHVMTEDADRPGYWYCESCMDGNLTICDECGECGSANKEEDADHPGYLYCERCADDLLNDCEECGRSGSEKLTDGLCDECYRELVEQEEELEVAA